MGASHASYLELNGNGGGVEVPDAAAVVNRFGRCILFYVIMNVSLICLRYKNSLLAASSLFAHITGFAAIDSFGSIQALRPFSDNAGFAMFVMPIGLLSLGLLYFATLQIRKLIG